MAKINVIEKTPGKHLEYRVSGEKIIFGDDDLSVKLSTRERDEETVLDITADKDQGAGGDTPATLTRVHFSGGEGPRVFHGCCTQSSLFPCPRVGA